MITRKELISIKSELNLYQKEKEYLLKLFLYAYYSRFEDAVFKGGTAIRFTARISRFSEDLDFNISISAERFKDQVELVLKDIAKLGIENYFIKNELFDDAFTCEVAFNGPLYDGTAAQTRNKFRIDAGPRLKTLLKPVWKVIDSEYPETKARFPVKVMDIREMLCEKLIAMFERMKGRDLYDAWFLLNIAKLDKNLLKRKLGRRKLGKNIVSKQEYERDMEYLVPRVIPYEQVKAEVLKSLK